MEGSNKRHSFQVLLVEDDLCLQTALKRFFKTIADVRLQWVTNAEEALEYLGTHACDLVISDFTLPGKMDGLGLWVELNGKRRTTPFVLMSGLLPVQDFLRLSASLDNQPCFLPKPFLQSEFEEIVRSKLLPGTGLQMKTRRAA